MLIYIGLIITILVLGFLGFVSTREGKFHYERSDVIQAPPEKIFPYLRSFNLGTQWSPYEKIDANMKKTYYGDDGQVGSVLLFEGNQEVGSGRLEILKIIPNESVEISLTMFKPFKAENNVIYKLIPEGTGTRFSWSMSGDGKFVGKFINVFIDCEKLVADQISVGIKNLKQIIENH